MVETKMLKFLKYQMKNESNTCPIQESDDRYLGDSKFPLDVHENLPFRSLFEATVRMTVERHFQLVTIFQICLNFHPSNNRAPPERAAIQVSRFKFHTSVVHKEAAKCKTMQDIDPNEEEFSSVPNTPRGSVDVTMESTLISPIQPSSSYSGPSTSNHFPDWDRFVWLK